MAQFNNTVITTKGQALMAKMIAGTGNVKFSKICTSDTTYSSGLEALTSLTGIKQTTLVSKVSVINGTAIKIEGAINNTELVAGYYCKTVGIYAIDPNDGEILYAVTTTSTADYIPPFNNVTVSGIKFEIITSVGNSSNVSLQVNPAAVATVTDIEGVRTEISNLQAYVGYTEADIYGIEADFANKKFTRLAGAVNKTPGAAFDGVKAFGGRRRCNVVDAGGVVAYYGDAAYTETGALTQAVTVGSTTAAVGTKVQVMVEQPKFYYKVVPLVMDKVQNGKGHHLRKARYYISDVPKPGFKVHPAFVVDGVEKDVIYLSAYEGSLFDVSTPSSVVDTLTIKAACTTAGTLYITCGNEQKTVSVSTSDTTTSGIATKIRALTFTGWTLGGSGDVVTFTATAQGTQKPLTITSPISTGVAWSITRATNEAGVYILDDAQVANFTVLTGDKLSSIANAKPISGRTQSLTRANTRKLAQNRGVGWQQSYGATAAATQLLFIIEYASFNTQSAIGLGVTNKTDDGLTNMSEITGATTNLGNASGMAAGTNGLVSVTYRGEENFWGNFYKWVDGFNIECKGIHNLHVADNGFADDITTAPYQDAGITIAKVNGYISAFAYNEPFDWLFIPSETLGSSSLPVGDYFYQDNTANGFRVSQFGGYWHNGSNAGGFYWYVVTASSISYRAVGGRLVYVP